MLILQLSQPGLFRKLMKIRRGIYTPLCELKAEIIKSAEPIDFEALDPSAFVPVRRGEVWGKKLDCAWLRISGKVPENAQDAVVLLGASGEGLVYSPEGEILDSVTTVWTPGDLPHGGGKFRALSGGVRPDGSVELFADMGYNGFMLIDLGKGRFHGAFAAVRNDEIYGYYYDFLTLTALCGGTRDKELKAQLKSALNRSYSRFVSEGAAKAGTVLAPHLEASTDSDFTYSAVGHGHLDMAWLWPLRETRRKAARTYVKALNNIEKYDGYIYGTSQPQQLFWMKQRHPALYERIKKAVADGRMELQGAFWVECDTNLTGGESLVRQAIFGRRFMHEEFGLADGDLRLCWLPDAFGFSGNLPQILKKSGMDWFSTIKLAWNKVNVFPHRSFSWEGIDGSAVLTHIPPEGDYNSRGAADGLLKGLAKYPERALNKALLVFGSGDGGGGPGETHLEVIGREGGLKGLPKVKFAGADSFFRELEQLEIPHTHKGELYLETHQGTYTTQGKIKYYNRLLERKLHEVEALSAFTDTDCRDALAEHWRTLLLNQFHDIIPGSSIGRVNREAVQAYRDMESALDEYFGSLAQKLPRSGEAVSAMNLTGFSRREYVSFEGKWYRASLAPYSAAELEEASKFPQLAFTKDSMTNGLLTLSFAPDGEIISCRDSAGGEHSRGGLNRLVLHRDPFQIPFDAWDIDQSYHKRRPKTLKAKSAVSSIDGAAVIRKHTYNYPGLVINQSVILEAESDVVRFETQVSWNKKHRMLRAEFYPAHYGDEAQFEIQFGHIQRPTTENNSVETAQFEVCAHKWAAVNDETGGFALLNNCKYGHRVKNGMLSLNLLRAPTFPDKNADRGEHSFTYVFCPLESGGIGKAIREGYRLNNPLHIGRGYAFGSFAETDNPAVVIETIKPAEAGSGTVLRLYESLGSPARTALKTRLNFTAAFETDLLENKLSPADLNDLSFGPFEIKTILLEG